MIKKIYLILAVAGMGCSLHMKAAVPPVTKDTVQLESYTDVEQMLRPLEPTYHKGVFVTSPWNGNWFVSLQGGASAFIGKPVGCADLFDRIKPTISASLGKWFTPQIGARIGYGGWQFKDCELVTNDYHHFHADLMWNGLKGSLGNNEPMKLLPALLTDSRAETMFKAGRKSELCYFLQHPMYFDLYWNTYKLVLRNNYQISDMSLWTDYIRLLERCGRDIHNAHYVCPLDLKAEHDRYQERVRIIQEREKREAQRKKAMENEMLFRELKGKFFGLSFTDGQIVVSVLESVDEYYQEGNALHHCVGQCEYYLKPKSLVFSARIDNQRIETIELSLETFKVLQSRGLCNKTTEYHDRIIKLVQRNTRQIRKRMTA